MRKLAAALIVLLFVAGPVAYWQRCSILRCPPVPDRDCGFSGQLCRR